MPTDLIQEDSGRSKPLGDGRLAVGIGLFGSGAQAISSSAKFSWRGFNVEEIMLKPSEMAERLTSQYFLALWSTCGTGEHRIGRSGFMRFTKPPGVLTFVPPGLIPAARTDTRNILIGCTFDAAYIAGIEEELGKRQKRPGAERTGFSDATISRLMELLILEVKAGAESGALYAESLAHALGTRVLMLRDASRLSQVRHSTLPRTSLRRVLERVHGSDGEVGLAELARESGYSRRHFLRMFQQTLGMPPHRYIMEVKLQRAQELMRDKSRTLIDIALTCGFASHSHMSRAFRTVRGLSPSELRRALN